MQEVTMIDFYFVKPSGQIVMTGLCSESDIDLQTYEGAELKVGKADCYTDYYKNNSLVKYPPKPDWFYTFDFESERWVVNVEEAANQAIAKRDKLLAEGPDRISPIWWASMTTQEQAAWTQYRQDLLDITEQADYPEFIVWPIKP